MNELNIAVSETGPVPDNQCALKDALLVAAAAGISDGAVIVTMAEQFFAFLQNPTAGTAGSQAGTDPNVQPQPEPTPIDPNTGQPVVQQ